MDTLYFWSLKEHDQSLSQFPTRKCSMVVRLYVKVPNVILPNNIYCLFKELNKFHDFFIDILYATLSPNDRMLASYVQNGN